MRLRGLHLGLLFGQRLDLGQGIQGRERLLERLLDLDGLLRGGQDDIFFRLGRLGRRGQCSGVVALILRRRLADHVVQGPRQAFHRQLDVVIARRRRLGDRRAEAAGRLRLVEVDDLALLRDHLGEIENVLLGLRLRLALGQGREDVARGLGRRCLDGLGLPLPLAFALFSVGDDPPDGGEYLLHRGFVLWIRVGHVPLPKRPKGRSLERRARPFLVVAAGRAALSFSILSQALSSRTTGP